MRYSPVIGTIATERTKRLERELAELEVRTKREEQEAERRRLQAEGRRRQEEEERKRQEESEHERLTWHRRREQEREDAERCKWEPEARHRWGPDAGQRWAEAKRLAEEETRRRREKERRRQADERRNQEEERRRAKEADHEQQRVRMREVQAEIRSDMTRFRELKELQLEWASHWPAWWLGFILLGGWVGWLIGSGSTNTRLLSLFLGAIIGMSIGGVIAGSNYKAGRAKLQSALETEQNSILGRIKTGQGKISDRQWLEPGDHFLAAVVEAGDGMDTIVSLPAGVSAKLKTPYAGLHEPIGRIPAGQQIPLGEKIYVRIEVGEQIHVEISDSWVNRSVSGYRSPEVVEVR